MLNTSMKYGKLYWIRKESHIDPLIEGYIGITFSNGTDRIADHFRRLRNGSHKNPILQNAFNKHNDLIIEILFEGSEQECIEKEIAYRPTENIGWNVLKGGGLPPSHKNLHWFTDGIHNRLIRDCPDGWFPGKTQIKGKNHGLHGKPKTYEVKGVKFSKGHVPWHKGLSGNVTNTYQPIVTCPHCDKSGGKGAMIRWHFENCKEKRN